MNQTLLRHPKLHVAFPVKVLSSGVYKVRGILYKPILAFYRSEFALFHRARVSHGHYLLGFTAVDISEFQIFMVRYFTASLVFVKHPRN